MLYTMYTFSKKILTIGNYLHCQSFNCVMFMTAFIVKISENKVQYKKGLLNNVDFIKI